MSDIDCTKLMLSNIFPSYWEFVKNSKLYYCYLKEAYNNGGGVTPAPVNSLTHIHISFINEANTDLPSTLTNKSYGFLHNNDGTMRLVEYTPGTGIKEIAYTIEDVFYTPKDVLIYNASVHDYRAGIGDTDWIYHLDPLSNVWSTGRDAGLLLSISSSGVTPGGGVRSYPISFQNNISDIADISRTKRYGLIHIRELVYIEDDNSVTPIPLNEGDLLFEPSDFRIYNSTSGAYEPITLPYYRVYSYHNGDLYTLWEIPKAKEVTKFRMGFEGDTWFKEVTNPNIIDIPYSDSGHTTLKLTDLQVGDNFGNHNIDFSQQNTIPSGQSGGYCTVYLYGNDCGNTGSVSNCTAIRIDANKHGNSAQYDFNAVDYINVVWRTPSGMNGAKAIVLSGSGDWLGDFENAYIKWDSTTKVLKFKYDVRFREFRTQGTPFNNVPILDLFLANSPNFISNMEYYDIGIVKPKSNTVNINNGALEVKPNINNGYINSFDYIAEAEADLPTNPGSNHLAYITSTNSVYISSEVDLIKTDFDTLSTSTSQDTKLIAIINKGNPKPSTIIPSTTKRSLNLSNSYNTLTDSVAEFNVFGDNGVHGSLKQSNHSETFIFDDGTNILETFKLLQSQYINTITKADTTGDWVTWLNSNFEFIITPQQSNTGYDSTWFKIGEIKPTHGNIIKDGTDAYIYDKDAWKPLIEKDPVHHSYHIKYYNDKNTYYPSMIDGLVYGDYLLILNSNGDMELQYYNSTGNWIQIPFNHNDTLYTDVDSLVMDNNDVWVHGSDSYNIYQYNNTNNTVTQLLTIPAPITPVWEHNGSLDLAGNGLGVYTITNADISDESVGAVANKTVRGIKVGDQITLTEQSEKGLGVIKTVTGNNPSDTIEVQVHFIAWGSVH